VTSVEFDMRISCEGQTVTKSGTMSSSGWPIALGSFLIDSDCTFVLDGTFNTTYTSVSGTWQGIACDPFPPYSEICRSTVGTWSATLD
jgi:hypothetical protein